MKQNNQNIGNNSKVSNSKGLDELTQERTTKSNAIEIPEISLPKGGGAIKGIDEKFEVNGANGTAAFSIPLPITPGRNGFSPTLSLVYNSGSGNGLFGLGWSVDCPSIQVKTDKEIPQYKTGKEEDIYMLSGVEDLVPYLEEDGDNWNEKEYVDNGLDGYRIKRYRPRVEGEFSRIEKIYHEGHGVYWKVTTMENVATIYGRSENTRISNPIDQSQIFQWKPEFTYDDKGNWIRYEYKSEDLENVANVVFERNRIAEHAPFTNLYLKRIRYGNRMAYYAYRNANDKPYDPREPEDSEHFFELVMDYGEHDEMSPNPNDNGAWNYRPDAFSSYRSGFEIRTNRLCERILMFHHFKDEKQFVGTVEEESFGENYLVRSLDLTYEASSINDSGQSETTYLKSISQCGYIRKPDGTYSKKSLPPIELSYEKLNWNKTIKTVDHESLINAPVGLTNNYQWVDLYGEGISGILTEQGEGWYYKNNLGDVDEDGKVTFTAGQKVLPKPSFTGIANGVLSLQDLGANGEKQIVVNGEGLNGYFELGQNNNWKPFRTFEKIANINLQDSNTRLLDITGNGQADVVITEDNVFTWYSADGKNGHSPHRQTAKFFNDDFGPSIAFADQKETIFLADMSGDGLTDIVRIRNGEVCYWANKGYGEFSAKVSMGNAPLFDYDDIFNPQYLHLSDVSGTGATDIIYLGQNKFQAFINLSGNAWSDAHEIEPFLPIDKNTKLSVIDLLGTGTSCIVWSSDLPNHSNAPMRYIDLMDSKKPHVLINYKNNFGKETSLQYKSSTHYYLKDKIEGKPWITKLPFPVQVVSKIITEEKITEARFTSEYCYHHGYYDHTEREFRGFGMVEQMDTEHYAEWLRNNITDDLEESEELYQKPVLTKTWFHTGAFLDREKILTHFEDEYWHVEYNRKFPEEPIVIDEYRLSDAHYSEDIDALIGEEYMEAIRACKGMMLRQEVFSLDAPENPTDEELQLQMKPYSITSSTCNVQLLQPGIENKYGVFLVTESENIVIDYERDESDFRVAHTLNTKIDELGNILESASVVYGRAQNKIDEEFQFLLDNITDFSEDVLNHNMAHRTQLQNAFLNNINATKDEQTKTHIIYTRNDFAKYNDGISDHFDIDIAHAYRLRVLHEKKTFEITGFVPNDEIFAISELENALTISSEIGFHENPGIGLQYRLIEHVKTKYLDNNLNGLDFGFYDIHGLSFESYQKAYTLDLVADIYRKNGIELQADGENVSDIIETKGGFFNIAGDLWIRSGRNHYKVDMGEVVANIRDRFFSPVAYEDPTSAITSVVYDSESFTGTIRNNDGYYLYIKSATDAMDNIVQIDICNYRTMSPVRVIDLNANPSSVLIDELGKIKAASIEGNGVFIDALREDVNIIQLADSFSGLKEYDQDADILEIAQLFGSATFNSTNTTQLRTAGNNLLKESSVRFIYDFDAFQNTGSQPISVVSISREEHFADNANSNIQFSFEYTDGLGNSVMTKKQTEPGLAYFMDNGQRDEKDTGTDLRWIGTGRTVLNNKGKPIKQYEPYFSTNFTFENAPDLVEIGVTPHLYYDSLGRLIKIKYPDGTLFKVKFDSWKRINFDQNDTLLESDWYNDRINNLIDAELIDQGKDPAKEKMAAQKSAIHANTPSHLYLDSLGRPILSIDNNGRDIALKNRYYTTFVTVDIEGNAKSLKDARGNSVMTYKYDMLGHRVSQNSMDAGERWVLNNLMGNPVLRWDSRDHVLNFEYDAIRRPLSIKVENGDGGVALDHIFQLMIYGEDQVNDYQNNLRGQVFHSYDTAGREQYLQYDYKGNRLETTREFNANYKDTPNWIPPNLNNAALFDTDLSTYSSQFEYDALSRIKKSTTPDNSETMPSFNEAGLLDQIRVIQTGVAEKIFVKNIDYDARGQRERIIYGDRNGNNLATTTYQYDRETFRLLNLNTTKFDGSLLQDLYYTYDPIGNISEIEDKAIPTKFFSNFKIEPRSLYRYDALYRLIESEGREHAGQATNFGQCDNWQDQNMLLSYSPGDDMAWRNYTQRYTYDPMGNILETDHDAIGGNWNREYEYEVENNRLVQTQSGGQSYNYPHHPNHGVIQSLPHLSILEWNFKDELQATARQVICNDNIPPETTYYVYDSNGQRVRKITENNGGGLKKEERLYIGEIEIYKKYLGNHSGLERTSLHVMDDTRRIVMIDTRNGIDDNTDLRTVRMQLSNHLDSTSLELDDLGEVISYEEYHAYGTTSYQALNKDIKAAAKRYRYTGMERDEESGLEYHSARYYIVWLGRWLNPDPLGLVDGINIYAYVRQNPIRNVDPTGFGSDSCISSCNVDGNANENPDEEGATDVVIVLYKGGIFGDEVDLDPDTIGLIGDLANELEDHVRSQGRTVSSTILGSSRTSGGAVDAGAAFIESHSDEDTTIIVYGYSRGGDTAVDLADELEDQNREIDLLFTVDAAYGPFSLIPVVTPVDRSIPENVDTNINFYQTSHSRVLSRGAPNTPVERSTAVYNIEVEDTTHGTVDAAVQDRVIEQAESFLDADNEGRHWTPSGMSGNRYVSFWDQATEDTPLAPHYNPSHLGWEADMIYWIQSAMTQ